MAVFTDAQLSIAVNQSNQTASVLVKGSVLLSPNDVGSFVIECSIIGDDPLRDEKLFPFPSKGIQGQGFTSSPTFEFSSTEQLKILNEDVIGKDEIYADLVLKKGNELGPVVSRVKTNVVQITA